MIRRFTGGERWVHWSTAALLGLCLVTAAIMYVGPLEILFGRRRLVELVHVYSGFALPVPVLLGWLSRPFRDDMRRLNRFRSRDWEWLRSRDRRSGRIAVGKFNPGQKLNAAFTGGAILVMLGTGILMFWPNLWAVSLRTGATFVHDWLALAVFVVVLGHIWYAVRDPDSLQGMRSGMVPRSWAARNHADWLGESEPSDEQPPRPTDPVGPA